MERMNTVIGVCVVSLCAAVDAQETEAPSEQSREAVPASPHQEQAVRELGSGLLERLDEDRDGSISRQEAEAEASLAENWSEYDRNGDAVLDRQELAELEGPAASSEDEDVQVAESELTEEGIPASRHQQEVTGVDLVERLDTDDDGDISRQEASSDARLQSDWDQLDRNEDGKLDRDELSRLDERP